MLSALPTIKGLIKTRSVKTDNFVFRLHYQVTSLITFTAGGVLVTNQLFGVPIECFTHGRVSFFMPHYIWKSWESEKMKMLSTGLENPLLDDRSKSAIIHSLTNYLLHGQMNCSIKYSFHLHFCGMMNLVIVGMNIWVTDYLFRNEFIGYGLTAIADMFSGSSYDFDMLCADPIKALFPQVAKCTQKLFGPSGNVVVRDHLCVLPLNDFNSHFFKFIWIWFAILLTVSIFWLLFRVASFHGCKLRSMLLSRRAGRLPVHSSHMRDEGTCCTKICSRASYADWVILMQLGSNMDPLTYKLFLESFCHPTGIKETGKPTKVIDKIYYSPV